MSRTRRVVTTRAGGFSRPPYDSFNLGEGVGDDPDAVRRNRELLADTIGLPLCRLVWMDQIHSTTVTVVHDPVEMSLPATDAVVTGSEHLALAVVTADCVPVLLSDDSAGVIAAVHAGRVGARNGVVPRTLDVMVAHGAAVEGIEAFLGPAASGRNYEVPEAMRADVDARLPGSASTTVRGTPSLDLRAGIAGQLAEAGVGAVEVDSRCTIEDATLFSHRRGAPTGRGASVIWLSSTRDGQP